MGGKPVLGRRAFLAGAAVAPVTLSAAPEASAGDGVIAGLDREAQRRDEWCWERGLNTASDVTEEILDWLYEPVAEAMEATPSTIADYAALVLFAFEYGEDAENNPNVIHAARRTLEVGAEKPAMPPPLL